MLLMFGIMFMFVIGLAISGDNKINNTKHPNYRGEDFDWDDNKQHTENI